MITYNHEKFIEQAINGVLMQECDFEVELILANDCSPDKTDEVIQKIIENHPRASWIKYIKHEKNLGMMPNFICALTQCQGKYIALCEGDDYWTDPLKLQKQVDFLDDNIDFSGCFHNVWAFDTKTPNQNKKKWRNYEKNIFDTSDAISTISLFHTSSYVFRNQLDNFPDWFKKVFSGDMALLIFISEKGSLMLLNEFMSVYRKNENGVTSSLSEISFHEQRIELWKHYLKYLPEKYHQKLKQIQKSHEINLIKLKYPLFVKIHQVLNFKKVSK